MSLYDVLATLIITAGVVLSVAIIVYGCVYYNLKARGNG